MSPPRKRRGAASERGESERTERAAVGPNQSPTSAPTRPPRPPTRTQVSAGGVAYRRTDGAIDVVLVSVGARPRWQLPKGLVEAGETPEVAAVREVREEAGIDTRLVAPLETIEYWYQATERGERVRFHKFVHFFLLEYVAGAPARHDHEVHDARWVPAGEAVEMLAFANEQRLVARGLELIAR